MRIEEERTIVTGLDAKFFLLEEQVAREQKAVEAADSALKHAVEAQEVLQLLSQAVQKQVHTRVSGVVTKCLKAVFDDPYEFRIEFERKRGKTEAKLRFSRDGLDVDPLTASGGGMIDVAAFALRAACVLLHRPRLSRVIVLDEPFKFVSEHYRENVRAMLESMSEDLGIQIIMVTHIKELETGNVIEL